MTDIREQEMQNRIDSLTLEKENLRYEIDCLKEQIAQLKENAGKIAASPLLYTPKHKVTPLLGGNKWSQLHPKTA